jgi:methylation protein EvaC
MLCKVTREKIKPFMSFGKMPIANGFLYQRNFKKEFFFDLEVGFSKKLSLFQINDHPKPEQMFNSNYPFYTGSSKGMVKHFEEYSRWIKKNYGTHLNYLVEIGSNDGTFLNNFVKEKIKIMGFEPSSNVAKISKKKGIKTINKFFNHNNVKKYKFLKKKVNIITAANVICHVPDLKSLINGVDYLLDKDGYFIFEEPYLGSMYKKVSYDQIYDEHIFIFSATSVSKIFKRFGFQLIDALPQSTHGGSMRYVVSRAGRHKVKKNLKKLLKKEKSLNIDSMKGCIKFKEKCEKSRENLQRRINTYKKKGLKIAGYGATSKSTTILNYCGIDYNDINYICDTTPKKIGKYSPGTHIPIVSMNHFYKNLPDAIFLFAWNHKNEIFKKEKKILRRANWFAHIKL